MSQRAYRITFDHKVSRFVIEFQGFFGLGWTKARETASTNLDSNSHVEFASYAEARSYVTKIGLDEVYDDFTKGPAWKRPEVPQLYKQSTWNVPVDTRFINQPPRSA